MADTRNFDKFEDVSAKVATPSPARRGKALSEKDLHFVGFTFKRFNKAGLPVLDQS